MPKVVDHAARRVELAEAVWRIVVRDGIGEVSIRGVAAEAGWSTGALRHYFTTRAELLAFAADLVVERVTERVLARARAFPEGAGVQERVRALLTETMPGDDARYTEAAISFAFLVLGVRDPEMTATQFRHFGGMFGLCRELIGDLADLGVLETAGASPDSLARRLHAMVDGLSVHVLAGHLTAEQMSAELDAHLAGLIQAPPGGVRGDQPSG
ncbi:TetR family transcriptional regulator C-terminal domain-containing protein [Nonomuraea sp. NBC_01738]|uniref:TetR/AcrR family transcriptional regulator n=1 Tax=Nonomuraea sp. NBC_01738 TaxID=2976003 RepID=UPI002E142C71|nr:TetR family transcriptional regulator C-terminal domain-containing protein [Nonomuraea sp. NBC_01738]